MVRGADFSSNQNRAALERALGHGLGFAFVKLTEGTGYVSPAAAYQLAVLRAHGVRRGVYHYLDAGDGSLQWRFFRAKLGGLAHHQELLVALDYEQAGSTDAEARAFLAAGRAAGYRLGMYSSAGTHAYTPLGQAWHWVAAWGKIPPPGPWAFWQFQAGTGGDPDWDLFTGTPEALAVFWQANAGRHAPKRYHVRFPGQPPVLLGPYRTLRAAAARALAYALRHPRRRSYTVTRSGG